MQGLKGYVVYLGLQDQKVNMAVHLDQLGHKEYKDQLEHKDLQELGF
jgi:hypothetical protein